MNRKLWLVVFTLFAMSVTGCGVPKIFKREPAPTRVAAIFIAVEDVNPDFDGRPSPIVVKLYELKSPDAFQSEGFFTLYERADTALAADLVESAEIFLQPGESQEFKRTLAAETRHLGLLAAYRDLDNAVWRALVAVPPNRTTPVRVTLGRTAIDATIPTN